MIKSLGSLDAFNSFATLHGLYIELGGSVAKAHQVTAPWFRVEIGGKATSGAGEDGSAVQVTEDFFRDFAALAGELEQVLIEHADDHAQLYPICHGTSTG